MANQPKQLSMLQLLEVVIPSIWKCESCGYTDYEERFKSPDGHRCPNCPKGDNEDVFPTRWFRCAHCGHEAEQVGFFGVDLEADQHPVYELQAQAICPSRECPIDPEWPDNIHVGVVEIPVPGFEPVSDELAVPIADAATSS